MVSATCLTLCPVLFHHGLACCLFTEQLSLTLELDQREESIGKDSENSVSCPVLPGEENEVCIIKPCIGISEGVCVVSIPLIWVWLATPHGQLSIMYSII